MNETEPAPALTIELATENELPREEEEEEVDVKRLQTSLNKDNNYPSYHYLSVETVCDHFESQLATGLTSEQARERLTKYGGNKLHGKKHFLPFWFRLLMSHTFTVINLILVVAAVLAGVVKEWVDFGVILFVVVTNIIIGFLQEYRSEKTMKQLQKMTTFTSKVLRDGHVQHIPSSEIVPGDIVMIKEGDSIPADIRIVESSDLECNEALLTGESVPVAKNAAVMESMIRESTNPVDAASSSSFSKQKEIVSLPLGDRVNCAFMSTVVTKGKGTGIVTATGMKTEIGKIASSIGNSKQKSTPLQKRMTRMSLVLVVVAVIAIGIVLICTWRYEGKKKVFPDALIIGISIAVAVIPECMVAVVTLTMTVGMRRMAQENVIVRKLAALENLGHVNDICTDKTGTLTEGKMVVTNVWTHGKEYNVTSVPSNPTEGSLVESGVEVQKLNDCLTKLITASALCNTSSLVQKFSSGDENETAIDIKDEENNENTELKEAVWISTGDPTEIALNAFSQKMKLKKEDLEIQQYGKSCDFPFDSTVKRMTVIYEERKERHSSRFIALTKGAPERIVDLCNRIVTTEGELAMKDFHRYQIQKQNEEMAQGGLRVISIAYKYIDLMIDTVSRESVESQLTFVGLIGIQDPPREEVPNAIKTCNEAGIVVHMVTGDHPATARSIAQQVGIITETNANKPGVVMEASHFDNLSEDELKVMEQLPLVIARCSPQSKVKMIKALHDRKRLVAMTGDGVNDAPAISDADIGIAMGKAGSDVTKEASDIILTDDNFASIVSAVRQGRRMSNNIRKFVIHLLSAIVALLLSLLIPVVSRYPIPMNATHILWVNLVTTAPVAIGLGVERPAKDIMRKDKYKIGESIFDWETLGDIMFYGALNALVILLNYFCMTKLWLNRSIMSARSVSFTTMVVVLLFRGYTCRSRRKPLYADQVLKSYWLHGSVVLGILLQVCVVYIPGLNTKVFHHNPLKGDEWAFIAVALIVFMVGAELYKLAKNLTALSIGGIVKLFKRSR